MLKWMKTRKSIKMVMMSKLSEKMKEESQAEKIEPSEVENNLPGGPRGEDCSLWEDCQHQGADTASVPGQGGSGGLAHVPPLQDPQPPPGKTGVRVRSEVSPGTLCVPGQRVVPRAQVPGRSWSWGPLRHSGSVTSGSPGTTTCETPSSRRPSRLAWRPWE